MSSQTLNEEIGNIDNLKHETRGVNECNSNNWEELIASLRSFRDQGAENYKRLTAEILTRVKLYEVIRDCAEKAHPEETHPF
jgi:hypothetical protein